MGTFSRYFQAGCPTNSDKAPGGNVSIVDWTMDIINSIVRILLKNMPF